jgi:cytochrome c peroxidase
MITLSTRGIHTRSRRGLYLLLLLALLLVCPALPTSAADTTLGLPHLSHDTDSNHIVVLLGKHLFRDSRLSADGKVSCGKCHVSSIAFTDGRARSVGNGNQVGTRNAPSLLNVVYLQSLFWDGRAADLNSQISAPLTNPVEQALQSASDALNPIRSDPTYVKEFSSAFGVGADRIDMSLVARALSAYERTLLAGGSPFDRYAYGHDPRAMNAEAIRGLAIFRERAQCTSCHQIGESSALFTDGEFHISPMGLPIAVSSNLGPLTKKIVLAKKAGIPRELERLIATDANVAALGRFIVTLNPVDIGKFRTPSLRNVALTAPYMHDGSVNTLEQAIDLELYNRGTALNYPVALTVSERADLLSFLQALTSPSAQSAEPRK